MGFDCGCAFAAATSHWDFAQMGSRLRTWKFTRTEGIYFEIHQSSNEFISRAQGVINLEHLCAATGRKNRGQKSSEIGIVIIYYLQSQVLKFFLVRAPRGAGIRRLTIDQRRVDVSRTSSNVSCNEFCLSVCHKKIHLRSYDFLTIYSGFVQSRIVLSHSTYVVKIIKCQ